MLDKTQHTKNKTQENGFVIKCKLMFFVSFRNKMPFLFIKVDLRCRCFRLDAPAVLCGASNRHTYTQEDEKSFNVLFHCSKNLKKVVLWLLIVTLSFLQSYTSATASGVHKYHGYPSKN